MVTQEIKVTCNFFGSTDVAFHKEYEPISYRRVIHTGWEKPVQTKEYDPISYLQFLDHRFTEPSSSRVILKCTCNKCHKQFEENLGTKYYPLGPGYIEA